MDLSTQMHVAAQAHQAGRLAEADARCTQILTAEPNHAPALHMRGLLTHQLGDTWTGIGFITQAIRSNPDQPIYHNNLGVLYSTVGHLQQAESCFRNALTLCPGNTESWYNLGKLHHRRGQFAKAVSCYRRALSFQDDHLDALNNLAIVYLDMEKPDDAIACCRRIVSLKTDYAPVYTTLGNAFRQKGVLSCALDHFKKAVRMAPDDDDALTNLAGMLLETGRADLALEAFKRAVTLNADNATAWGGLGSACRQGGQLEAGLAYLKRSIQRMPENYRGYQNLGNIYLDLNEPGKALTCYHRALRGMPNEPSLHLNAGLALRDLGRSDQELEAYKRALHADPGYEKAWVHLAHFYRKTCDWSKLETIDANVDRMTAAALKQDRRPEEMPFLNIARHDDPALNQQVAAAWSARIVKAMAGSGHAERSRNRRCDGERITIGYLSNNFKNHPTAHLISGIFDLHDRRRFNIYTYSYGENDGSIYRQQIEEASDRFVDLSRMDHPQAAMHIRQDRVDILVDLVGHMRNARLEIPALRPAPVQVRWLGMAGTTGSDFFDYLITHPIAIPPDQANFYNETFVYLPDCYQVNNHRQNMATDIVSRNEEGLPESAFVLSCFCTHYKIDRPVFESWMRLLRDRPRCVLWLLDGGSCTNVQLMNAARAMGVNPCRLILAPKVPRERHLRRLTLADLGVDTWCVNGAATTSDALWAGIPVVTRKGRHFASRMSANIVTAMGLPELVETEASAYEQRILRYCDNAAELRQLKETLQMKKKTAPLFDTPRFVRHLEAAFTKMWHQYIDGREPQRIDIAG